MSRDPLRERDLGDPTSIFDRIIENDAREAAAADRDDDGIELAPVVPLRRRRWPYAVAAAALAAVIAGTSWIAGDRSSLTAEPLADPTPTATVPGTPGPTPEELREPSPTPEPTGTPTPTRRPTPTPTRRTPSATASPSATPTTTASTDVVPVSPAIEPRLPTLSIVSARIEGDNVVVTYSVCTNSGRISVLGPWMTLENGAGGPWDSHSYRHVEPGQCLVESITNPKGRDPVRGKVEVRIAYDFGSAEAEAGFNTYYDVAFDVS
ncbi:MAG: hypothetical protein Q4G46_07050 [Propionibacteriaceae bacterium]|nr:hypothetical protein [Propionibacteriaceae bacterium]